MLPGESQSPFQQGLKGVELDKKLGKIYDAAIASCAKMWSTVKHDKRTFLTITHPILSDSATSNLLFNDQDHKKIHKFIQKSNFDGSSELEEDLKFYISHCTRSAYKFELVRCTNASCHHCSKLPQEETNFVKFLRSNGGYFPNPISSKVRIPTRSQPQRRYMTISESLHTPVPLENIAILDHDLPSRNTTVYGQCYNGCRYVFLSKADQVRHDSLMHK